MFPDPHKTHKYTVCAERSIVPSFKAVGTYSYHSGSNFQQYLLYNEDNFPLNLTTVQHLTLISLFLLQFQRSSGPFSNLAPCTSYPVRRSPHRHHFRYAKTSNRYKLTLPGGTEIYPSMMHVCLSLIAVPLSAERTSYHFQTKPKSLCI